MATLTIKSNTPIQKPCAIGILLLDTHLHVKFMFKQVINPSFAFKVNIFLFLNEI